MLSKQESAAIVNALVGLGNGLGITTMAEGVTDPAQQAALLDSGVDQVQGGLYGQALAGEETLALFGRPGAPKQERVA